MKRFPFRHVVRFAPFALATGVLALARSSVRTPPVDDQAVRAGRRIFEERCGVCHATGARAGCGWATIRADKDDIIITAETTR